MLGYILRVDDNLPSVAVLAEGSPLGCFSVCHVENGEKAVVTVMRTVSRALGRHERRRRETALKPCTGCLDV